MTDVDIPPDQSLFREIQLCRLILHVFGVKVVENRRSTNNDGVHINQNVQLSILYLTPIMQNMYDATYTL